MIFTVLQALKSFKLGDLASVTERLLGISFVHHHKEYGSIKKVDVFKLQIIEFQSGSSHRSSKRGFLFGKDFFEVEKTLN